MMSVRSIEMEILVTFITTYREITYENQQDVDQSSIVHQQMEQEKNCISVVSSKKKIIIVNQVDCCTTVVVINQINQMPFIHFSSIVFFEIIAFKQIQTVYVLTCVNYISFSLLPNAFLLFLFPFFFRFVVRNENGRNQRIKR